MPAKMRMAELVKLQRRIFARSRHGPQSWRRQSSALQFRDRLTFLAIMFPRIVARPIQVAFTFSAPSWLGALFLLLLSSFSSVALDLSEAVILSPTNLSRTEKKAVEMLIAEVAKRSQIRWRNVTAWPDDQRPVIAIGPVSGLTTWAGTDFRTVTGEAEASGAEGYRIRVTTSRGRPAVFVVGNDARGVLFGAGHLLRVLQMGPRQIALANEFSVATQPKYPLRGHQLGYRPKTNSYDAWDLATWEQYIRDLIIFGANAIELIPPRSDDDADSPHFPLPPMEMMIGMSGLADAYGIDVWIWYPAMDPDYGDAKTVERALQEWGEVFRRLPRVDAVFVPGGDPGHTHPRQLLALLEKQTEVLHRSHPQAQMWVSPQSFNQEWLDEFLSILERDRPGWLSGVVFGPQVRISLSELRRRVPLKYPIRHYPDITHSRQCQYPVPDWDVAFAVTEGRECINPRPHDQAAIFRLLQPDTMGFLTYSEGCNDDVNKVIWSALGWNPDADVTEILREYSRVFIGERFADNFAQGLLALERNWRGRLIANEPISTTLQQFQAMEKSASPRELKNWRFQQALYRAYYDAYTRRRLVHETDLEERALQALREGSTPGALTAMAAAEECLDRAWRDPVARDWRTRIFELADALFQSIGMQLSVPRYQAIGVDRGATLDTLDSPLSDRLWLKQRFAEIRGLPLERDRRKALDDILDWTNPGPGGFYDDFGNTSRQPHLVWGKPYDRDPAFLESPHAGFGRAGNVPGSGGVGTNAIRRSWIDHAESMNDGPLQARYTQLDPKARYKIRVVYAGDSPQRSIRLVANDGVEIHPLIEKPAPVRPLEFDLPPETTRSGQLTLSWFREPGLGGNGRGCQVAELWLMKR